MTPVMQSKLYCEDAIHSGNCYAACLASLLDLPLWMVPPFEDMFARHSWRTRTDQWLERFFGLRLTTQDDMSADPPPGFYIANGPSSRGVTHSVIYRDGKLAHDPHPSGEGIKGVEWLWYLEPIGEVA